MAPSLECHPQWQNKHGTFQDAHTWHINCIMGSRRKPTKWHLYATEAAIIITTLSEKLLLPKFSGNNTLVSQALMCTYVTYLFTLLLRPPY